MVLFEEKAKDLIILYADNCFIIPSKDVLSSVEI